MCNQPFRLCCDVQNRIAGSVLTLKKEVKIPSIAAVMN